MNYKNVNFNKISSSEKEINNLLLIGIKYDKRLKNALIQEFQNPTEVNETNIIDFQKSFNIILPQEYFNFLSITNGGIPDKNVFDITLKKNIVINHLFTVNSKVEMYTLAKNNNNELISFPKNFLAIGDTVNGDYILMNLEENSQEYGAIFVYLHDKNGLPKKISSSFDSFIEKLYE